MIDNFYGQIRIQHTKIRKSFHSQTTKSVICFTIFMYYFIALIFKLL